MKKYKQIKGFYAFEKYVGKIYFLENSIQLV